MAILILDNHLWARTHHRSAAQEQPAHLLCFFTRQWPIRPQQREGCGLQLRELQRLVELPVRSRCSLVETKTKRARAVISRFQKVFDLRERRCNGHFSGECDVGPEPLFFLEVIVQHQGLADLGALAGERERMPSASLAGSATDDS